MRWHACLAMMRHTRMAEMPVASGRGRGLDASGDGTRKGGRREGAEPEGRRTRHELCRNCGSPQPDFCRRAPRVAVRVCGEDGGGPGLAEGRACNDREERDGVFEAGALFCGLHGRPCCSATGLMRSIGGEKEGGRTSGWTVTRKSNDGTVTSVPSQREPSAAALIVSAR